MIGSGSSGNCYLINDGKTALLLDAGVPFSAVQQAMDFDTGAIRGCLITHRHGDHAKAGKQLAKRGIKVYGNTNTAVDIGKGACVLQPRIAYGIDTFTILPFEVEHDVPCFGYRIDSLVTGERLVYITDAAGFRFSIKGATHLLVECNHSHKKIMERVRAGEMNAMLGKGRSMDLLDPVAMRMLPVLDLPYGDELSGTICEDEDENSEDENIYNDSFWA